MTFLPHQFIDFFDVVMNWLFLFIYFNDIKYIHIRLQFFFFLVIISDYHFLD